MKPYLSQVRFWILAFCSVVLAACGGGGDSKISVTGVSPYVLSASISSSKVTGTAPGAISIKLQTPSGGPASGQQVTLTTQLGNFGTGGSSITLTTDSSGSAQATLYAGTVAGNGAVVVSYTDSSNNSRQITLGFSTDGSQGAPPTTSSGPTTTTVTYTLTLALVNSSGAPLGSASNPVSAASPGTANATLVDSNGNPVANQVITFTSTLGTLNPTSGTALTNALGVATVGLSAGTTAGAGVLNAAFSSNLGSATNSVNFSTLGNGGASTTTPGYNLTLALMNQADTASLTQVTGSNPGLLVATLTDKQGSPQANQVITFTSTLGTINPTSGTALTNAQGVATVNLGAGTVGGAGTATASYGSGTQATVNFSTDGSATQTAAGKPSIQSLGFTTSSGAALANNTITTTTSGVYQVKVLDANGNPIPNQVVAFSEQSGGPTVTLTPSSSVLTNSSGVASVTVTANAQNGAGTIQATTSVSGASVQTSGNFQVILDTLALGSTTAGKFTAGTLAASAASVAQASSVSITANLVDVTNGNSAYTTPTAVTFTTACSKSSVSSSVTSQSGAAVATYTAGSGCTNDTVTATATLYGQVQTATVALTVQPAAASTITFVSASPTVIGIQGSSSASTLQQTSAVMFQVLDANANPVANSTVNFSLSTTVGGITLSSASGLTNSSGDVTVTVQSGTVPTPVRVTATLGSNAAVSAVSSGLSISTGLPSQNNFQIAVATLNPRAATIDGTTDLVTAYAADEFGNPVPDGTVVQFYAEIGTIPAQCTTAGGQCSVTWTSSGDRQATYDPNRALRTLGTYQKYAGLPAGLGAGNNDRYARATILAFAIGEESYQDSFGTNRYDPADPVYAFMPDAFLDTNEDGQYDNDTTQSLPAGYVAGSPVVKRFVAFTTASSYAGSDGLYHGVLCDSAATAKGNCASLIDVRASAVIDLATDDVQAYVTSDTPHFNDWVDKNAGGTPAWENAVLGGFQDQGTNPAYIISGGQLQGISASKISGQVKIEVILADKNGNSAPAGTMASISGGSLTVNGASSCTVPNQANFYICKFSVSAPSTLPTSYSPVVITVTTPNGNPTFVTNSVINVQQ